MQMIGVVITALLAFVAAHMQRRRGAAKAWCVGTAFWTVGAYLDRLFFLIMEHGAQGDGALQSEGMQGRILQGIGLLVSKGILTAVLLALGALQEEKERDTEEKDVWEYLDGLTVGISLFFLIPVVRGAVADRLGTYMPGWGTGGIGEVLTLTLYLGILLFFYVSLYLHGRKQRQERQRREADARKHEAEIYLESVENHYQRTRELWHDLRNHISLLRLFLQEEKYGQMADYLRIFGEDVDSLALPVKSGNAVVDALFADKTARAKRDGAAVEVSLCDLSNLRMKPDEICGLLGNLLDNALEANRRVEGGRFLEVECENREEYCYIRIRNADGGTESGKKDKRNQVGHGIGLRSAQRIAHSCGGELAAQRGTGCFTTVVRLPLGGADRRGKYDKNPAE